ncbi:hypothetical protein [Nocardioides luteus]|uniref:hypothetical protein n=1 Tax=Nocardioides luteus TaxID=1844 RepID=UPI0018CAD4C5|nr:hypothetical protein [Nocardioides luteus]MBG6095957.1 hypothetical protein [Nocardioides luteus]
MDDDDLMPLPNTGPTMAGAASDLRRDLAWRDLSMKLEEIDAEHVARPGDLAGWRRIASHFRDDEDGWEPLPIRP